MVDIASVREEYYERTISNIGLILCEHNDADGLTKVRAYAALINLLRSYIITHPAIEIQKKGK